MVINNDKTISNGVKFIDYTGDFPNLCSGKLILEINGKRYRFGNNYFNKDKDNLPRFWTSGGHITSDYVAMQNEWIIDAEQLPSELKPLANDIDRVFNDNVPYGCCGGCI